MGGSLERGKDVWGVNQSIYFGTGQYLTDQPGFAELSPEVKAKIRMYNPLGTPRGYSVDPSGKGGEANALRTEVQPDRIIFCFDKASARLEVMTGDMSRGSEPFSMLPVEGDLRPVLDSDLPPQYQRGYVPPQDQEVE